MRSGYRSVEQLSRFLRYFRGIAGAVLLCLALCSFLCATAGAAPSLTFATTNVVASGNNLAVTLQITNNGTDASSISITGVTTRVLTGTGVVTLAT